MTRLLLATLAVFACLVAPAAAQPFTPEVETMYEGAIAYWGASPELCTSITQELVSAETLSGNLGDATEPHSPMPCVINISEDQPPCEMHTTMYHEVGHLLGHDHSANPLSIMFYASQPFFCEIKEERHELAADRRELSRCRYNIRLSNRLQITDRFWKQGSREMKNELERVRERIARTYELLYEAKDY